MEDSSFDLEFLNLSLSLTPYSNLVREEGEALKSAKALAKANLLQQLKTHENYFYVWLRDEPLNKKRIKTFIDDLPDVPTDLANFTKSRMMLVQLGGAGCVEAFLYIYDKRFGSAATIITRQANYLEHCLKEGLLAQEYYNGFHFVLSLLKLHLRVEGGSGKIANWEGLMEKGIREYPKASADLEPMELAAVLCVKWMLDELIHSRKVEAAEVLQKMHELDPGNWVWSYLVCSRVRFIRRQFFDEGNKNYPDHKEIEAISSALKHTDDTHRAMCLAGACQALAEILRWRSSYEHRNSRNEELQFGDFKTFGSNEEIAAFILETAKEAAKSGERCFGELIRYGEILSSIVPRKYQDLDLAESCLMEAFQLMPENSKANHRLGVFLLTARQDKEKSSYYLRRAVLFSDENFPAWMDYIQILLSVDIIEKTASCLTKIFVHLLGDDQKWATSKQRAAIYFLRGLFAFLKHENSEAISYWIKQAKADPTDAPTTFRNLYSVFKRYSFRQNCGEFLDNIFTILKERFNNCDNEDANGNSNPKEKADLEILLKKVEDALSNYTRAAQSHHVGEHGSEGFYNNRQRQVSEADKDDCWRKSSPVLSPPVVPTTPPYHHTQTHSTSSGTYPSAKFDKFQTPQAYRGGNRGRVSFYNSNANNNANSNGNHHGDGKWQPPTTHFYDKKRSPSPESWR